MMQNHIVLFAMGAGTQFRTQVYLPHGVGLAYANFTLPQIASGIRMDAWKQEGLFAYQHFDMRGLQVWLVTNLCGVNEAGTALNAFLAVNQLAQLPAQQILVIHDDIHTNKPKLQRRVAGDGGHNGIKSIVEQLGSSEFARIKIGVLDTLDRPLALEPYFTDIFPRVNTLVTQFLGEYAAEYAKWQEVQAAQQTANTWNAAHLRTLSALGHQFSGITPAGEFNFAPVFPVIDGRTADQLQTAALTIWRTVQHIAGLYHQLLALPGDHQLINVLEQHIPPHILQLCRVHKPDLSYLGMDFHGPSSDKRTDVSLIEMNRTTGGVTGTAALQKLYAPEWKELQLGLLSQIGGVDAIVKHMFQKYLPTDHSSTILIIDSHRDDQLDLQIYNALLQAGYTVEMAEINDGRIEFADVLYFNGAKVLLAWCLDIKYQHVAGTALLAAAAAGRVRLLPSPMVNIFTFKSFLPILANPQLLTDVFGVNSKTAQALTRIVPHSEFVTPANLNLLKLLVAAGAQVPVKHIAGGGSRLSWVVTARNNHAQDILNACANAYGNHNPAIFQSFAPHFPVTGTNYRFDVRCIAFAVDAHPDSVPMLDFHTRVYGPDSPALLGNAPLLVRR